VVAIEPSLQQHRLADEARHLGVDRVAVEGLRVGSLDDLPASHHRDGVRQRERLLLVVGDEKPGGPGRPQGLPNLAAHLRPQAGVERVEGLVEQDQARFRCQRPGQRHALLLSDEGNGSHLAFIFSGIVVDMNVLVVEDEVKMAALLRRGLSEQALTVDVAGTGEDAISMARSSIYDAIVLDVVLPGIDGFETCRRLRRDGIWAPVLMLTARGTLEDRLAGLDGGADDYLTKPFSFAELLARLRALVRRGQSERSAIVEVGALRLDPATHQAWRGETEIELSAKEFVLLETFMRRPGHVLSRSQLLDQAWEYDFEHRSNVIEVYIRYLRRKIDAPFGVTSIETVRGAGYRMRKDGGC
jgi:two-component system, OmpR family, response regulator